jgi:hypothetical protein
MSDFCAKHELTIGDINAPSQRQRLLPDLPGWTLKDAEQWRPEEEDDDDERRSRSTAPRR